MSDNEDLESIFNETTSGNTLPPLLLSENVKSDIKHFIFYMLRLTPESDNYSLEDVKQLLRDITSEDIWFCAEELSKKSTKHYHCVFISPNTIDPRQEIKDWLVAKFPGTWKKQDGNKRYNLQVVEDNDKAFMYSSKDGDYFFGSGLNPEYIKYVNSKSYQKKDTRVGQLMGARARYIQGELSDSQLFHIVCDVCIATSSTGSLNMTYVKSFMTGAKAQKDPRFREKLFDFLNL